MGRPPLKLDARLLGFKDDIALRRWWSTPRRERHDLRRSWRILRL
jgi:hypothetical protein